MYPSAADEYHPSPKGEPPKAVARGVFGHGKTSCKGQKGQQSRKGHKHKLVFEGGQMPLVRRLPKRGFKNYFRVDYAAVNVSVLNAFDNGAVVDAEALAQKGILKQLENGGLKILGGGDLEKKLTVRANAFSESAKQKIEAAGGAAEEV